MCIRDSFSTLLLEVGIVTWVVNPWLVIDRADKERDSVSCCIWIILSVVSQIQIDITVSTDFVSLFPKDELIEFLRDGNHFTAWLKRDCPVMYLRSLLRVRGVSRILLVLLIVNPAVVDPDGLALSIGDVRIRICCFVQSQRVSCEAFFDFVTIAIIGIQVDV